MSRKRRKRRKGRRNNPHNKLRPFPKEEPVDERMFCPVCEHRPCVNSCPIGFRKETELLILSALLEVNDPR